MNFYVIVEGKAEAKVYPSWIKWANPRLTQVFELIDFHENNFLVYSGGGYPYLKDHIIPDAIKDVKKNRLIDTLVIALDSEEKTLQEKFDEINEYVKQFHFKKPIEIIVQHFCFECWGLGNQVIIRRHPQNGQLINYQKFYNVIIQDPEQLPEYPPEDLDRVTFAYKYLHKAINDRYTGMTYSKERPTILITNGYIDQLARRLVDTRHINSFQKFLDVFRQ